MKYLLLLLTFSLQAQTVNLFISQTITADGVTQFYRMAHVPIVPTVQVYVNGARKSVGIDYGVYPGGVAPRIGFFPCCIPTSGQVLVFNYHYFAVGPQIISVMTCVGPTTSTSDCTGLYYIHIITTAGTELKILGAPFTAAPGSPPWNNVP